jgi:putative copper export protein
MPDLTVFKQPYGQLLLTKVALFAVLMGLAALNKWVFGAAIGAGDARVGRAFRRTVVCEYILICAVLAVTATMTTFYSPESP